MNPGILFQRNGWQSFSLVWNQVIEHEIIDTCMLNVKIVSDPVLLKLHFILCMKITLYTHEPS